MYVRDYLEKKYGEERVELGGLIVTTTLDWKFQEEAENIVAEGAAKNERLLKANNMALVAIDPKTGDIWSMVGSRDYFDTRIDGNFNVATALRQPGSAFKPFVYATAFRKGFTPDTVIFDVPTEFHPNCTPDGTPRDARVEVKECYHPGNFDEKFRGPVTLRSSIAQSLNVPSVKVLYMAGINDSVKTAEDMGITTLSDPSRFGLSLVLGGAEVKLLEMTAGYAVFANNGVYNPYSSILKVETANGQVLEERHNEPRPVLDQEVARTLNDVLSDNDARIGIFAPRSSLYFPDHKVAVKTGTTQDYRDAWTIGYTPSIAIGVWVGNNDNTPFQQKGSGVMAAAPHWRALMDFAISELPPEEFPSPSPVSVEKPILRGIWQGDTIATIDTISGKLATDLTPPETRKDIAFGAPHDPLFWIDRYDPTGDAPQNPENDPQYANWEFAFQKWFSESGILTRPQSEIPTEFDDVHTEDKRPYITLSRIPEQLFGIRVTGEKPYTLKEIALVAADDHIIASYLSPTLPLDITVPEEFIRSDATEYEVRAYDSVGNIGRATIVLP